MKQNNDGDNLPTVEGGGDSGLDFLWCVQSDFILMAVEATDCYGVVEKMPKTKSQSSGTMSRFSCSKLAEGIITPAIIQIC